MFKPHPFCCCLVALLSCQLAPAAAELAHVAIADFNSDTRSYRNIMAASDFSAALQGIVSAETNIAWVERNQWQAAAQELKLAAFNNRSLAGQLQLGKWVKADLLVIGDFEADPTKRRQLKMKVIDLDNADVLAECETGISGPASEPLRVDTADLSTASQALGRALKEAQSRRQQVRAKKKVALLFLGNTGPSPRLDFVESDVAKALQKVSMATTNVHVLRLPHAREATDEAELVIGGLVGTDLNAWQRVADLYVWGQYAEGPANGLPFEQVPVDITWQTWDGRGETRQFKESAKVGDLPKLTEKIARAITDIAQTGNRSQPPSTDARGRVAQFLLARANETGAAFEKSPSLYATPQGHNWWQYQIKLLNLARFFDPQNHRIQKTAVLQQWTPRWATPAPGWFAVDLWAQERCAADFAAFVDKFGIDRDGQFDSRLARLYVQNLQGVLQELHQVESDSEWAADWPVEVRRDWHRRLEEDFLHRIQLADAAYLRIPKENRRGLYIYSEWEIEFYAAIWQPVWKMVHNPEIRARIFEDLWTTAPERVASWINIASAQKTFVEIGQADKGQAIADGMLGFERIWAGAQARRIQERPPRDVPSQKPTTESITLGLPPFMAPPPRLHPSGRAVDIPGSDRPQGVAALSYAYGKLWISAQNTEKNQRSTADVISMNGSGLPDPLYPLLIEPAQSWLISYDPSTRTAVDLTSRLGATSKVTSTLEHNGKLWLTLQGNGVWCLDPKTFQVQRFGSRDGVVSEELYAVASAPPHLFFGGGQHEHGHLGALNTVSSQWTEEKADIPFQQITSLCGWKQYVLLAAHQYTGSPATVWNVQALLLNTTSHSWQPLKIWPHRNDQGVWKNVGQVVTVSADEKGFWFGSTSGLFFFNPDRGTTREWRPPQGMSCKFPLTDRKLDDQIRMENTNRVTHPFTRLRGSVTALAHDGDFLWVATTAAWEAILIHKRGAPPNFFEAHDFHFIFLLHKPSGRWVGQFQTPNRVSALAVSSDRLWIGLDRAKDGALYELDKQPLTQIPETAWVSDDIKGKELDELVAGLELIDQGRFFFIMGNTNKVVSLLKDEAAANPVSDAAHLVRMSSGTLNGLSEQSTPDTRASAADRAADLLAAAREGDLEGVRATFGATDEATRNKALGLAAAWGKVEIVKLLLSRAVDVNSQSDLLTDGDTVYEKENGDTPETPLMRAARSGRLEVARELIARGAKLDVGNIDGNTALHIAANTGNTRIIELLLAHGASLEARNRYGWTPLMCAAQCGSVGNAQVLLKAGARLDITNNSGLNMLTIAQYHQRTKMIELLKEMKAPAAVKIPGL